MSSHREQFSAYPQMMQQLTASPLAKPHAKQTNATNAKTALGFLLCKDQLSINPNYAWQLVMVYNLQMHDDLVEILHNYSVKELLSFLDQYLLILWHCTSAVVFYQLYTPLDPFSNFLESNYLLSSEDAYLNKTSSEEKNHYILFSSDSESE